MNLADAMRYCDLAYHRELYAKLALYVYLQKRDASSPLHIQYDGSEKHREALRLCILQALPIAVRQTLQWGREDNAFRRGVDLIFMTEVSDQERYLIPETGQTDISEPALYPLFVTYAAGNLPPEDFNAFFDGMDERSRKFCGKSDENSLSLAYACWNPETKRFSGPDAEKMKSQNLMQFLADAAACGGTGSELSRLARLVRKESERRGLIFSSALRKYLDDLDENFPENTPQALTASATHAPQPLTPSATPQPPQALTASATHAPQASTASAEIHAPQPLTPSATPHAPQPLTPSATPHAPQAPTASPANAPPPLTVSSLFSLTPKEIARKLVSATQKDAIPFLWEIYDKYPQRSHEVIQELKTYNRGDEYLSAFYSALISSLSKQATPFSWKRFERIADELPESCRSPRILENLYINIWKFYGMEIDDGKDPIETFDAYRKLLTRIYDDPEPYLHEAKEKYWRTVSWKNFNADKLHEYETFLLKDNPANQFYALARLAEDYRPGLEEYYLRKVFLYFDYYSPEGQGFGQWKGQMNRNQIAEKLADALRKKYGDAVPVNFPKWITIAANLDKGPYAFQLIPPLYEAMTNYDPQKLYQAYSDFYYNSSLYASASVGKLVAELLKETCEKYDSKKAPVPLDLWLWIAEKSEGLKNFFEIFNSYPNAAVLDMNPEEVKWGSVELKAKSILEMATEYFMSESKDIPKKAREAVKEWTTPPRKPQSQSPETQQSKAVGKSKTKSFMKRLRER